MSFKVQCLVLLFSYIYLYFLGSFHTCNCWNQTLLHFRPRFRQTRPQLLTCGPKQPLQDCLSEVVLSKFQANSRLLFVSLLFWQTSHNGCMPARLSCYVSLLQKRWKDTKPCCWIIRYYSRYMMQPLLHVHLLTSYYTTLDNYPQRRPPRCLFGFLSFQ